jgi:hypothetical protein
VAQALIVVPARSKPEPPKSLYSFCLLIHRMFLTTQATSSPLHTAQLQPDCKSSRHISTHLFVSQHFGIIVGRDLPAQPATLSFHQSEVPGAKWQRFYCTDVRTRGSIGLRVRTQILVVLSCDGSPRNGKGVVTQGVQASAACQNYMGTLRAVTLFWDRVHVGLVMLICGQVRRPQQRAELLESLPLIKST